MKRNKRLALACAAAGMVYVLLIAALCVFEGIDDFKGVLDVIWYSFVTITTVGYGDVVPGTIGGRLIGVLFLLLSAGFLSMVIGFGITMARGCLIPAIRMRMDRNKEWYVFSELNKASIALADSLEASVPDALMIFCGTDAGKAQMPACQSRLILSCSMSEVLDGGSAGARPRAVFLIGTNERINMKTAVSLRRKHDLHAYYCRTSAVPDASMAGITPFNQHDNCARLFWQKHPLQAQERHIVMIGCGRFAEALLNRALLVNVFGPEHRIVYHVFGEWAAYRGIHSHLADMVAIDGEAQDRDSLCFHNQPWCAFHDLLAEADRIILCHDDETENWNDLQQIRRYYVVSGDVYVRMTDGGEGAVLFGNDDEIFSPELVMRMELNRMARKMHALYSRDSGGAAKSWEELDDFLQQSNIAAADHMLTKVRILLPQRDVRALTPEICREAYAQYCRDVSSPDMCSLYQYIEHERWCRFYYIHNWVYAPERCDKLRRHNCLQSLELLDEGTRLKDEQAWKLIGMIFDERATETAPS